MKYVFLLAIAFTASSSSLAYDDNDIEACVDMVNMKQAELGKKPPRKQAKAYCTCITPKLESLPAGKILTREEFTAMINECGKKAGMLPQNP